MTTMHNQEVPAASATTVPPRKSRRWIWIAVASAAVLLIVLPLVALNVVFGKANNAVKSVNKPQVPASLPASPSQAATNDNGCPSENGNVTEAQFKSQVLPQVMHQRELAYQTGNTLYLNCYYEFSGGGGYATDTSNINGGGRVQTMGIETTLPLSVASFVPNKSATVRAWVDQDGNVNLASHLQLKINWVASKQLWLVDTVTKI
jgi:hypothetical protein